MGWEERDFFEGRGFVEVSNYIALSSPNIRGKIDCGSNTHWPTVHFGQLSAFRTSSPLVLFWRQRTKAPVLLPELLDHSPWSCVVGRTRDEHNTTCNEHSLVRTFWGIWVGVEFTHLKDSSLTKVQRCKQPYVTYSSKDSTSGLIHEEPLVCYNLLDSKEFGS